MMKHKQPSLSIYVRYGVIASLSAGLFLFLMLVFLTFPAIYPNLNFSTTGQIGDTIGGITAPFIGVSAAILTFLAFYMQFKANETHNRQFDEQSLDKERESYEQKILYLIKQNRNIAESMSIGVNVEGSKCFTKMFDEYRCAYEIVNSFYGDEISNDNVINISFLIFYNGVGKTSNAINNKILSDAPRISNLLNIFDSVSSKSGINHYDIMKANNIEYSLEPLQKLGYKAFDGHTTRLGQYFRNLFHILKYTQDIDCEYLSEGRKYQIIKSLRSQLSSYEQILIYFNSLSLYGKPLRDEGIIDKFKLIKNIPIPLIDFSGDIHKSYPKIEFEWDEIIRRAENV